MQRKGDLRDRNGTPCLPAPPPHKHTLCRRKEEETHGAEESWGLALGPPGAGRTRDGSHALLSSQAQPRRPRRVGEPAEAN